MRLFGLHGSSVMPFIIAGGIAGGCAIPGVMATRTMRSEKEKMATMLTLPLMNCGAKIPVFLMLTAAFFAENQATIMFCITLSGWAAALVAARILRSTILRGESTPFVMELPPYRMPTFKSIIRHTWDKGAQYLKKMGGIIMVASILIWFLGYYPNHDAYSDTAQQQEHSYIGQIGKAIEPVIEPLGFDWKLGIGLLSGVGAKELVVSTLGVLYTNEEDLDSVNLSDRIPITPVVALAYMLFVLIYFPCVATLAAIKQESGSWKWAIFAAFYTTALAWIVAFVVNQVGHLIC
jgi:ferrous iron transport protein B